MKKTTFDVHADLEDRHWWFVARRKILLPLIDKSMKDCRDDLIVDVGCGTGGTVAALNDSYNILGFDSSEVSIALAKTISPECQFHHGVMPEDLRKTADKTGLFLLMDVLEHVEHDQAFLSDLFSITRPGGHILITVPAKKKLWSQHDVVAEHFRRYELDELCSLWADLPVRLRLVSHFNSRLYPLVRAVRLLTTRLNISIGRHGTDFNIPPWPLNNLLTSIFAGEAAAMESMLDKVGPPPYSKGVSLLALLQRE